MTLELTPDQLQEIRAIFHIVVKQAANQVTFLKTPIPRVFNTEGKKRRKKELAESIKRLERLESLHDLLTNSTAVILYRP